MIINFYEVPADFLPEVPFIRVTKKDILDVLSEVTMHEMDSRDPRFFITMAFASLQARPRVTEKLALALLQCMRKLSTEQPHFPLYVPLHPWGLLEHFMVSAYWWKRGNVEFAILPLIQGILQSRRKKDD